ACDEDVLAWSGSSQVYAESILKVCDFCVESPLVCAAGVGSNLKKRIEDIMKNQVTQKLSFSRIVLLVLAALTSLAGPIMLGITHAKSPLMPILSAPAIPPEAPPIVVAEEHSAASSPAPRGRVRPEITRTAPAQNPTASQDSLEVVTIRPSVPDPN